jgi:hypothetical protein
VTCEIGAFEVPEMPVAKREFAGATVKRCDIQLDAYFGWFNPAYSLEKQRVRDLHPLESAAFSRRTQGAAVRVIAANELSRPIVLKNSDFRFDHNCRGHRPALKNLG